MGAGQVRQQLLDACHSVAHEPCGLFTLTAPTGSGKTLSSMAFALAHAARHGLERVIYALPFTSVTEQNAKVFRNVFLPLGEDIVLEHHSAYFEPMNTDDSRSEAEIRRELTIENWDAPVVVTTNVQLLESLFASDTKRCRKLHRVAKSVIVLDEAQSLPVHLLAPTLEVLKELTRNYGATVVLCSATMPAVMKRHDFAIGLDEASVKEIVPDPQRMATSLKRVSVRQAGELADETIIDQLALLKQALVIVNTKPHAASLFTLAKNACSNVMHLSASMCPAHRSECVREIKRRLHDNRECRVISTQVVEAGVDIDFPVVYRAMAGLDSIVQAAGRCNREGRLPTGEVIVFETDVKPPPEVEHAAASTREVLDDGVDPLDLATMENFFRLSIWKNGGPKPQWDGLSKAVRDAGGITGLLQNFQFERADNEYKIINDENFSIVVPWGKKGTELCEKTMSCHTLEARDRRKLLRQAQAYTVGVRQWTIEKLNANGVVRLAECGAYVLNKEAYDADLGVWDDTVVDPQSMIA